MPEDIIRKLPFSAIAEKSVLGSILIDPSSLNYIADMINAEDFYLEEHKQIYLAMHQALQLLPLSYLKLLFSFDP